jgi:hypothetical protein
MRSKDSKFDGTSPWIGFCDGIDVFRWGHAAWWLIGLRTKDKVGSGLPKYRIIVFVRIASNSVCNDCDKESKVKCDREPMQSTYSSSFVVLSTCPVGR